MMTILIVTNPEDFERVISTVPCILNDDMLVVPNDCEDDLIALDINFEVMKIN